MFMNITKKLQNMLQKPSSQDENKNPMVNSFKNKDLAEAASPTSKIYIMSPYGLSPQEMNDIRLDLTILDNIYDKWA